VRPGATGCRSRLLKNSVQRASLRLNRSLAEDKVTHRLGDRSGSLFSETPFHQFKGFFNILTWLPSTPAPCVNGSRKFSRAAGPLARCIAPSTGS